MLNQLTIAYHQSFSAEYFLFIVGTAFLASLFIYVTRNIHLDRTARGHAGSAVQSCHDNPTPRIGGVAVMLSLILGIFWSYDSAYQTIAILLVSALPIFAAGLSEDLSWHVSPRGRLVAAAMSAALMVALSGIWLHRADVPIIDQLLKFAPFAIIFSIFAATGMSHALNLIDGVNGLASGTAIITAIAFALIGTAVGDNLIVVLALTIAFATFGFFVLNFPFGKIFLGDAGAYTLGYLLGWTAILLVVRNPDVSAWAVLLMLFWPLSDTLHAIGRRWTRKQSAVEADSYHMHHVVMRALETHVLKQENRSVSNPLSSALILTFQLAPASLSVLYYNQVPQTAFTFCLLQIVYFAIYAIVRRIETPFHLDKFGGKSAT